MGVNRTRIIAFGISVISATSVADAQRIATATSGPTVEARRVSMDLISVPLSTALTAIAQHAGLIPVYDATLLPAHLRVTLHIQNGRADEAFQQALRGTGLIVHIRQDGQVAIVRAPMMTNGIIVGTVIDAATKRPIAGAVVTVDGASQGIRTLDDGSYRVTNVAAGSHTVTVRRIGFVTAAQPVTVTDDATVTLNLVMHASANTLDQVVVTGMVIPTELKAVPNAITVITAKQIEERGIRRIDQLFRGDVPGLFALNSGGQSEVDQIVMFSRGGTAIAPGANSTNTTSTKDASGSFTGTNAIKTYVDGVELTDPRYVSQIDPSSIERIEILAGPQASTIYGSGAINGVMQIFTKRGATPRPQLTWSLSSGFTENNFSNKLTPNHTGNVNLSGVEGRWSYNVDGSADYTGSWAPGRLTTRYAGNSAGVMTAGQLTVDMSGNVRTTENREHGDPMQGIVERSGTGIYRYIGIHVPTNVRSTADGQTLGLTVKYAPTTRWSNALTVGHDALDLGTTTESRAYSTRADTVLNYLKNSSWHDSQQFNTTANIPLLAASNLVVTLGGDHWRTQNMVISARPVSLTGTLQSPSITRTHPDKNSGGFVQASLGIRDALFFTYGLRAEWNPNFGTSANPNIAPKYGVAYSRDVGPVTTKVRASYGRSTRPPESGRIQGEIDTDPAYIALFGPHFVTLPNPDLGPEFQQGGEGGVDLYFGNHASLVVTRYNQTVDGLNMGVGGIDSLSSLQANDPECSTLYLTVNDNGYCYFTQSEWVNAGSIRNQGWELQGSVNTGPFTTRGTYSWTKSRVIGVTQRYRALVANTFFAQQGYLDVGRPFLYMAEHTWMVTVAYARAATDLSLTLNGIGQVYKDRDDLSLNTVVQDGSVIYRLTTQAIRWSLPNSYKALAPGYATADLNAAHRFSSIADLTVRVHNLTDFYRNDGDMRYPTMGRQTQIGVRIRTK